MVYYYSSCPYERRPPSIFDGFTLRPLPYPILLILTLLSLFLYIKLYPSYEEVVETTEFRINWLLLATPLLLIFAVRWLSSLQNPGKFFGFSPYDHRKASHYCGPGPAQGASPWVVAGLIVLVVVLVQLQSIF